MSRTPMSIQLRPPLHPYVPHRCGPELPFCRKTRLSQTMHYIGSNFVRYCLQNCLYSQRSPESPNAASMSRSSHAGVRGMPSTPTLTEKYRRNGKLQSCEPCRKSKLRCDHVVPACGRCVKRGKVNQCFYHPNPLTQTVCWISSPDWRCIPTFVLFPPRPW